MKELKRELWKLISKYGEAMANVGYHNSLDIEDFFYYDDADDAELKLRAFIEGVEIRER